jgi:integrase
LCGNPAPHHLRHTYASQALAAGESIYYVQKQLGHAQIDVTVRVYGSWLPAGSAETAARIEARALGVVTSTVTSGAETGSPAGGGRGVRR